MHNRLSPVSLVALAETSPLASDAGTTEAIFKPIGTDIVPAATGQVMPPQVTVPRAKGKLKVLASQMSPVQSSLIRPAASMWILKLPPLTTSSREPVPVKVTASPILKDSGCKSVTFPCVVESPQSSQVMATAPPSTVVVNSDCLVK